jgi:hypothetical protein
LLSRRATAAHTLMEETDLPVEAITARVGLTSAVNLRRRFRARTGTTPGAYRLVTCLCYFELLLTNFFMLVCTRRTLARISSAVAVQVKGFACWFQELV